MDLDSRYTRYLRVQAESNAATSASDRSLACFFCSQPMFFSRVEHLLRHIYGWHYDQVAKMGLESVADSEEQKRILAEQAVDHASLLKQRQENAQSISVEQILQEDGITATSDLTLESQGRGVPGRFGLKRKATEEASGVSASEGSDPNRPRRGTRNVQRGTEGPDHNRDLPSPMSNAPSPAESRVSHRKPKTSRPGNSRHSSARRQQLPALREDERKRTAGILSIGPPDPNMLLQPDSRPISQEQLAAEVKSIYSALIIVENKCMNVDRTQAAAIQNAQSEGYVRLPSEHWQALTTLHRTLLHEHHDLILASQHPSASEQFARYRMAIKDEDPRDRETWASVARFWYNKAARKTPIEADRTTIFSHHADFQEPDIGSNLERVQDTIRRLETELLARVNLTDQNSASSHKQHLCKLGGPSGHESHMDKLCSHTHWKSTDPISLMSQVIAKVQRSAVYKDRTFSKTGEVPLSFGGYHQTPKIHTMPTTSPQAFDLNHDYQLKIRSKRYPDKRHTAERERALGGGVDLELLFETPEHEGDEMPDDGMYLASAGRYTLSTSESPLLKTESSGSLTEDTVGDLLDNTSEVVQVRMRSSGITCTPDTSSNGVWARFNLLVRYYKNLPLFPTSLISTAPTSGTPIQAFSDGTAFPLLLPNTTVGNFVSPMMLPRQLRLPRSLCVAAFSFFAVTPVMALFCGPSAVACTRRLIGASAVTAGGVLIPLQHPGNHKQPVWTWITAGAWAVFWALLMAFQTYRIRRRSMRQYFWAITGIVLILAIIHLVDSSPSNGIDTVTTWVPFILAVWSFAGPRVMRLVTPLKSDSAANDDPEAGTELGMGSHDSQASANSAINDADTTDAHPEPGTNEGHSPGTAGNITASDLSAEPTPPAGQVEMSPRIILDCLGF